MAQILICCTIYDSAVEAYMRPFFVPAVGAAMRAFTDEVNNPQGDMFKHPEDYVLFELGEWDDQTGRFVKLLDDPRQLARGKDVLTKTA